MESAKENQAKRNRGIRASRIKLNKALADAGLKTQAALADRIADLEKLEVSPVNLVSRVFREQSVDPKTIERIANALSTDAYLLYLTSEELPPPTVEQSPPEPSQKTQAHAITLTTNQNPPPTNRTKIFRSGALIFCLVLVVATATYFAWPNRLPIPNTTDHSETKLQITILDTSLWPSPNIVEALLNQADEKISIGAAQIPLALLKEPAWMIAKQMPSDFVLDIQSYSSGRHHGVIFNLVNEFEQHTLASAVWSGDISTQKQTELADTLWHTLKALTDSTDNPTAITKPLSSTEVQAYVNARNLLESDNTVDSSSRAQSNFVRALTRRPDFIEARAGLCETWARLSLTKADTSYLTDAEQECGAIETEANSNEESAIALANLARRRGDNTLALKYLNTALSLNENSITALVLAAEAHMSLANQGNAREQQFADARAKLEQAITLAPGDWRAYHSLGRYYYFLGDMNAAIDEFQNSFNALPNFVNSNNLGVVQFCFGNFDTALEMFLSASKLDPGDARAQYQIGSLYLFTEQFNAAIDQMKSYMNSTIELGGSNHQDALTGIADAYRLLGDRIEAEEYYRKVVIETENINSSANPSHTTQAQGLYAKARLAMYNNAPKSTKDAFIKEAIDIQEKTKDPRALTWSLLVLTTLGETKHAKALFDQLYPTCKGYVGHPDLKQYHASL